MNKVEIDILKAIDNREDFMGGAALLLLSKALKINPKLLQRILLKLGKLGLVEDMQFPNGKIDYRLTRKGSIYLKKLK